MKNQPNYQTMKQEIINMNTEKHICIKCESPASDWSEIVCDACNEDIQAVYQA